MVMTGKASKRPDLEKLRPKSQTHEYLGMSLVRLTER